MSALTVHLTLVGVDGVAADLQRTRKAMTDRGPLNSKIATDAAEFTREYLRSQSRHRSAQRLGATPTGHDVKSAGRVESASTAEQALVRIPRNTGLGRAFGPAILRPGPGKTYLTIPGDPRTYGKVARDFPDGTFKFAILHSYRPFPVLLFKVGGAVAYWLRKAVTVSEDRSVLPSDEGFTTTGRRSAMAFLTRTMDNVV